MGALFPRPSRKSGFAALICGASILGFVIGFLLSAGTAFAQAVLQPEDLFGYVKSTEPLKITLGRNDSIKLEIPKAYLTYKKNWNGGHQEFADIEMVYPAMTAWSLSREERGYEDDWRAPGENTDSDLVTISLKSGGDYLAARTTAKLIERNWRDFGPYQYGFHRYRWEMCTIMGVNPDGSPIKIQDSCVVNENTDYLVAYDSQGSFIARFECPALERAAEHLRCRASTDFDEALYLEYTILRGDLHRWQEIDMKIRELVTTLVRE